MKDKLKYICFHISLTVLQKSPSLISKLTQLVATVGGIGFIPGAPGTYATVVAIAVWYFLNIHVASFQYVQWMLWSAYIIVGILSAGAAAKRWGEDPQQIVIDEV